MKLFVYGTLLDPKFRNTLLERSVRTDTDVLKDYALISHPVLHLYPVVVPSEGDIVKGVVFEVSEMELERLDRYETEYYKRENVTLDSGVECMVYVQNKDVDKE